ncbi:MAG: YraN family protein [Gemmatimonadales bacterium]
MAIKSDPAGWTDPRHRRGYQGEETAKGFLAAAGWEIMAHRFRLGRIEIDLIARRGSLIAFVEVKTRKTRAFGSPLEAVTWAKKREIVRVARGWMDRYGRRDYVYRFDVIGVTLGREGVQIEHVEDAFRPGWR